MATANAMICDMHDQLEVDGNRVADDGGHRLVGDEGLAQVALEDVAIQMKYCCHSGLFSPSC